MSHFTVLVIGENWEEQLAPFQEQTEDLDKSLLEFWDAEEESREDYETGSAEMYRVREEHNYRKNVVLRLGWDSTFQKPGKYGIGSDAHEVPEGAVKIEVPFKILYPTFEEYLEDWCSYERDETKGKYGRWSNPNAKWDWYSMGGRWSGMLRLKPDTTGLGAVGRPGSMGGRMNEGPLWADQCRKGDLDLRYMREDNLKKAREKWEEAEKEHPLPKMYPPGTSPATTVEEWSNLIRRKALPQSWVNALRERNWRYGIDYGQSLEDFLKKSDKSLSTFAVLKDGTWHEKGKMGWWACVSNEKDQKSWAKEFNNLLDSLPDDTVLTVVDCHI